MTQTEEAVLVRELGKLAGFFGGFWTRVAARRLPVEESVSSMALDAGKADVEAGLSEILGSIGKLTREVASETPAGSISAIVGSGNMNLNPTIVHLQVVELSPSTTNLLFRALAKEGLIKQQSAERAIERIKTLLSTRYTELPPPAE